MRPRGNVADDGAIGFDVNALAGVNIPTTLP